MTVLYEHPVSAEFRRGSCTLYTVNCISFALHGQVSARFMEVYFCQAPANPSWAEVSQNGIYWVANMV